MVNVALPIKLAFVLLGLGFLLHLIGFAAPYWHAHEWTTIRSPRQHVKLNYGLWRYCHESTPISRYAYRTDVCLSMVDSAHAMDYIRATQFFETVGFLAAIAAVVLLLLGVCITSCRDRRILPILSAIAAVAAAGCIILGCIIFGAKDFERPYLSWAFALAIVGGILHGLAGILIFVATLVIKK